MVVDVMIKPVVKDVLFLSQKSVKASKTDMQVVIDLQDTLKANRDRCVGMAANMIGVNKRIIIVNMGMFDMVMINPVLLSKKGAYTTQEGCLSLDGVRNTTRYEEIELEFYDLNFIKRRQKFTGWIAQICQHELDHLEGIII